METTTNRKSVVQTAAQTIAQALGVETDEVKVANARWVQFMKEGVICSITLRRWRARARLHFDDLGLPVDKTERESFEAIMQLGEKYLLPQHLIKELNSIDAAARQNLKRFGFDTPWGVFVPVTAFAEWLESDKAYEARYNDLQAEIVDNWQQHVGKLLADYATQARVAYRNLRKLDPEKMSLKEYGNEDAFVNRFITRIEAMLPTPEYVEASFAYERDLKYIPLPDLLAQEAANAKIIEAEAESALELQRAITAKARGEQEVARRQTNAEIGAIRESEALASARIAKAHNLELDKLQAESDAVAMRQQMLLEMNALIVDEARQQKQQMVNAFLSETVAALREAVYEVVTDVANTLDGKRHIHPRSVKQLQNLLERVQLLNFANDVEIEKIIAPVKAELQKMPNERDAEKFSKELRNIGIVTRQQLVSLGKNPRSGKALNIPDRISDTELRKARASLGLQQVEVAPGMSKRTPRNVRKADVSGGKI